MAAVKSACERLGVSHQYITSGAGHDACQCRTIVAPTSDALCALQRRHQPPRIRRSAEAEDLEAVCNVLLHAVLDYAGVAN